MNVLVTYDVQTTTAEGRRRLRRVARVCLDFGQRVQYSVFECSVGDAELVQLRGRLLDEIDPAEDSLRLYRLVGNFTEVVESHGKDRRIDYDGPLVV
jgi:CRISPR-associated protein Cas2